MATLDPLLRALVERGMDALVLESGQYPRLRQGGREREVTQSRLDRAGIDRLLDEVRGTTDLPVDTDGATSEFDYRLGDTRFHFTIRGTADGWSVRVTSPADAEPADATAAEAPIAAQPTPTPTPTQEPASALPGIDSLLTAMIERGASDLHLSSRQKPRLRIDGEMTELPYDPPSPAAVQSIIDGIVPATNRQEFDAASDTDFAYALGDSGRFRVNLFMDHLGPGFVFRHIPTELPTFEQLRLPSMLRRVANLSKGLVLVTGPTGSGKSTTLAAILDLVNRRRQDHIITIEDPIEFVHKSRGCMVNQRQVGLHTTSFQSALRAALREDPDIIMVGEMRDLETTAIAIQTAETGHLVFGTLHTTTAPSTVERLIDQFPTNQQAQIRTMLSESLVAVIAQNLLPRIGGGRVAVFEILICTAAVSNLIREGKTFQIQSAMQTGKQAGMRQLNDGLTDLVTEGLVKPAAAYLRAVDKEALLKKFERAGIRFDPETDDEVLS